MYPEVSLFTNGPRTAFVITAFYLPTSRGGGNSRCQPRHGVQILNRDTLCLALLREHRRNASEARRPNPIYTCEWWDSGCVLRRLAHKQPYSIEPARCWYEVRNVSQSVSQKVVDVRTAGNATADDACHRDTRIEKLGLLLGLDLNAR
jgi:hypothetical protein